MALNSSGPISLAGSTAGQSIALELSLSATGEISLNTTSVRTLAGKPSGAVVMPTDFWGKSSIIPVISMGTNNTTGNEPNTYNWSDTLGFGSKFSSPGTTLASSSYIWGLEFSKTNLALVAAVQNVAPYIAAWAWSSSGFGTKYANPSTTPTNDSNDITFTPDGSVVLDVHQSSNYVAAYPWSDSTGFGSRYATPSGWTGTTATCCKISNAGNSVIMTNAGAPYVNAYAWSNSSGFGSRFSNPSTAITGTGDTVDINPSDTSVSIGSITSRLQAYAWSNSTGFGSKYTNPATFPNERVKATRFSNSGNALINNTNTAPSVYAYQWNSSTGFGTKYTDPSSSILGNDSTKIRFSKTGLSVAFTGYLTPFVVAYPWNDSTGFGTKFANPSPAVATTNYARGLTFNS